MFRISTPDTCPRHVEPEYGIRIDSTPSSAVPVSTTLHVGADGVAASAFADHVITDPVSVPVAVPDTFRSPEQDALNDPFAEFDVCSVGLHLKSEHEAAAGTMLAPAEAQLPINAATPAALGAVDVVLLE